MKLTETQIVTPALIERFAAEAEFEGEPGGYYALIPRDDGDVLAHHPYAPAAEPHQLLWAQDVLRKLNRELHRDGAWVVCFTHPGGALSAPHTPGHVEYARYCLIWLDPDGDAQFTLEWRANESELLDFADVMLAGIESTLQKCETAWTIWHTHMRKVLEPREGQTYRRAQGERPPSGRR